MNVAIAQFNISSDIAKNLRHYLRQIAEAAAQDADVVVFSEASLCGYGGFQWNDWRDLDAPALAAAEVSIRECLAEHKLWGVIGTASFPAGRRRAKPLNANITIDDRGRVRAVFGKVFCTPGDLTYYSAGSEFPAVSIDGIKTGSLVCFDFRFPEMYREYLKKDVRLMFNTFYQIGSPPYKKGLSYIAPIHLQSRAAENGMFIAAPNTATKDSAWGSMIIDPDGDIILKLPRARNAVGTAEIDIGRFDHGWGEVRRRNALRATNGRYKALTLREAERC